MSTVELTRESDAPHLVDTLAEHGVRSELVVHGAHLAVQVENCDGGVLAHAIEDWIREHGLPLVPLRIDDHTFAVSPPAA